MCIQVFPLDRHAGNGDRRSILGRGLTLEIHSKCCPGEVYSRNISGYVCTFCNTLTILYLSMSMYTFSFDEPHERDMYNIFKEKLRETLQNHCNLVTSRYVYSVLALYIHDYRFVTFFRDI